MASEYERTTPRGGSVFSGTITTTLRIVEGTNSTAAVKTNVWRNAAGEIELTEDPKMCRSSYNFAPAALLRDGYKEVAS